MSSWQDYVNSYSVQPDSRGFFRVGDSNLWVNTYFEYETLVNRLGSNFAVISDGAGEVSYFAEGDSFYAVYTIAEDSADKTITVSEPGVVNVLLVGAGGDAGNVAGAGLEQTIQLAAGDYTATIGAQGGAGAAGGDTSFATLTAAGGLIG